MVQQLLHESVSHPGAGMMQTAGNLINHLWTPESLGTGLRVNTALSHDQCRC